ncbi:MAG: tryptophan-rich sensory protein [Candidatus Altiarchaeota archaeon]|nr:tryptophan-rich sensory protein [Candidatus Altiarchaeota archaeon]
MAVDYPKLSIAILACLAAGFIGSIFTAEAIPTWYASINKPELSPPNWVFAPVWSTLYVLMGVSAYLVWKKGLGSRGVKTALLAFVIQLALNAAWSFIFFGMRNPFLAFVEIIALWVSIAATILLFYRISRPASYLLVPYIVWVSFAAYLNYAIWQLN